MQNGKYNFEKAQKEAVKETSEKPILAQREELESAFVSRRRITRELDDFFMFERNHLVDDQFKVNTKAHEKVLEAKEKGIEPLHMLARDSRIKQVIDGVAIEEALRLIPILEKLLLEDPSGFSEYLQMLKGQDISASSLKKFQERYAKLESLAGKRQDIHRTERWLKRWGIEYDSDPAKSTFSLRPQPQGLRIARSQSPNSIFLDGPALKEEMRLAAFYKQNKLQGNFAVKFAFPTDTIIAVTSYVDQHSATLHGVGTIYKANKIYAAYPVDIASERVSKYLAENDYLPQILNWESLRKVSNSEFGICLNRYYFYPELWISGTPQEVFIRPYSAIVCRSKGTGSFTDDAGRALAAVLLSRTLGVPISILK